MPASNLRFPRFIFILLCLFSWPVQSALSETPALSVATFQIDATPPLGSPLCIGMRPPAVAIDDPLSARGIILLPARQKPIVLVAVDWLGISNAGHDAWREAVAAAAATTIDRVSVHVLHQHDAPGCDFSAYQIAAEYGLADKLFDLEFEKQTIARAAAAVKQAIARPQTVTHIGAGKAKVEKVASTRRCLGPDGKVKYVRYTSCKDPKIRAYPEGTIDPYTKVVSFFNGDKPIVLLTYYATHPQSHYGKGHISADFVGLARSLREEALPGAAHIHFNGAGGNIGAGKYNDGSPKYRAILAGRLAQGMTAAWEKTERFPIEDAAIQWDTREVALPPSSRLNEESLLATLADEKESLQEHLRSARELAWLRRCESGHTISIGRLRIGRVDILHLPGELFVEYQLAAQKMRPNSLVCTAAYGDRGMAYIGLASSYTQGGYETGRASRVAPAVETVLMKAISELMQ